MRKIRLCDNDASFFDEEMMPGDYDFLAKHKDTFRRMWFEQGKTFWTQFVSVFRSYIVRYSLLGDLPCDISQLQHALDFAFKVITRDFVDGKPNQAKNLLYNIAELGRSKHKFVFLDSKSFTKDPFYTKDTRDIFREFFGPATEKASYVRVYLLCPVYMRFGRSVVRCLELWKDAPEMDPCDDSYYVPPLPFEPKQTDSSKSSEKVGLLCPAHLEDCNMKYYQQFVVGSPETPVAMDIWGSGDPRRCEPRNPLFHPDAPLLTDWRNGLTCEKFQEFYIYCATNLVKPEDQCQDCRAVAKKARKKQKKKLKKQVMNMESVDGSRITGANDSDDEDEEKADSKESLQKPTHIPQQNEKKNHLCPKHAAEAALQTSKNTRIAIRNGGDHTSNTSQAVVPHVNGGSTKRVCFTSSAVSLRKEQEIKIPCPRHKNGAGRLVFEVMTKTDAATHCKEVRILVKEVDVSKLNCTPGPQTRQILGGSKPPPLNSDHIRQLISSLPSGTQWAEGSNWCAVSLDYSFVDATNEKPPTQFILKVFNPNVFVAKEVNFALLRYIVQRKRRPSVGWVLGEDDIYTWCQGLKKEDLLQLLTTTFTISTGMGLDDSLSPLEEKTRTKLPGTEMSFKQQKAVEKEIELCNMLSDAWKHSKSMENSLDFIDLDPDDAGYAGPAAVTNGAATGASAAAGENTSKEIARRGKKGKKEKESKKVVKAEVPGVPVPAADFASIDPMTAALHNTLATISGNPPNLGSPRVVNPTELGLPEGCDVIGLCARDPDGKTQYLLTARDPYDTKTAKILKDLGYETLDFGTSQYDRPIAPPKARPTGEAVKALELQEAEEAAIKDRGRPLSVCANCNRTEPVPKLFKKCQRCKEEGAFKTRYYCGRQCQTKDWIARHRNEHMEGMLH